MGRGREHVELIVLRPRAPSQGRCPRTGRAGTPRPTPRKGDPAPLAAPARRRRTAATVRRMRAAPSDLDALARAGEHLSRLGSSIGDAAWSGPTPCSEWTVGDLVDHVVGGNVFTVEVLGGATADDAMATTMATFGDGYERAAALAETTRRQHDAFATPGALDGRYHHINGTLGGRDVLRARLHDLIVHGWDLAEALDPPAAVDDDLVAWAAAELAASDSLTAEHFGIDASTVTDEATFLTAFGRTPMR